MINSNVAAATWNRRRMKQLWLRHHVGIWFDWLGKSTTEYQDKPKSLLFSSLSINTFGIFLNPSLTFTFFSNTYCNPFPSLLSVHYSHSFPLSFVIPLQPYGLSQTKNENHLTTILTSKFFLLRTAFYLKASKHTHTHTHTHTQICWFLNHKLANFTFVFPGVGYNNGKDKFPSTQLVLYL